jgi:hypothetical protein
MSVFEKGLITVLCCDLLFVLIAIPLTLRKIPRNMAYGFRTRTTLSDDFIWYEANAHFGRGLVISSIVSAAAFLLLYLMKGLSPSFFLVASIIAMTAPALGATIATAFFIRTLKSDASGSQRRE